MNSQWRAFLESQSASIGEQEEVRFDDGGKLPGCALFDLSHLRLVQVSGEDARDFLQGQFSNDTRNLDDERSQMSSYCSPKGRMLACFRIFMRDGDFFLQMPADSHATVMKRLPMFVLMSRVSVQDASDSLVRIGLAGDCADSLLGGQFGRLPANAGETAQQGDLTLIRHPGETPRYEIVGPADAMTGLWSKLAAEATSASQELWSLLDIRAGIPAVFAETGEAFVPQMTNLQLIDGVSFTKGCYTGQEVVARMKYLGKLKRRMYLARVDSETGPKPGDDIFSDGSESGQGAGKVVAASPSPDGGHELLAVTEISAFERDDVHLGDADGPKLTFQPLPYPFEEE